MASFRHMEQLGALFIRGTVSGQSSLAKKLISVITNTESSHFRARGTGCFRPCFSTTSHDALDISGIFPPIPTPFVSSSSLDDGAGTLQLSYSLKRKRNKECLYVPLIHANFVTSGFLQLQLLRTQEMKKKFTGRISNRI